MIKYKIKIKIFKKIQFSNNKQIITLVWKLKILIKKQKIIIKIISKKFKSFSEKLL